jgi:hypothetical protein
MSTKSLGSLSFNNLRVGKCYYIQNFGETTSFMVLEVLSNNDFKIKDLLTLEIYNLRNLTRYGKGSDFTLLELEENQ